MENNILLCGGLGYIGFHITKLLLDTNYNIIILDIKEKPINNIFVSNNVTYITGSICNQLLLEMIFEKYRPILVINLSGYILVGESINDPIKYYENNISGGITLIKTMIKYNVRNIIFS